MKFRERSATDLAVLGIVVIVGTILVLGAVSIVVLELVHPDYDSSGIIEAESEILAVLVGALVGFIGGRAAGRNEVKPPDPP